MFTYKSISNQQSAFFTILPVEVRLRIYSYVLAQQKPLSLLDMYTDHYYSTELQRATTGITLACRQSHLESQDILWEVNAVKVGLEGDYGYDMQRATLDRAAHALRVLILEVLPGMYLGHLSVLRRQVDSLQAVLEVARGLDELVIVVVPAHGRSAISCDEAMRCFAKLRYGGRVVVRNRYRRLRRSPFCDAASAECMAEVVCAINGAVPRVEELPETPEGQRELNGCSLRSGANAS